LRRLLNYRHAFHAGNFADLLKHSLLLAALRRLGARQPRLQVFDTHAGAGLYDLGGEAARRSGEAAAGVARLMATPEPPGPLGALKAEIAACNGGEALRLYPGSPWLAARALRQGQGYVGCELREDDGADLRSHLAGRRDGPRIEVVVGDGYAEAARRLSREGDPVLMVIDPPFERADDYARIAELVAGRPRPERQGALVWTPLKDLETFDAFLGRLEAHRPGTLQVAQLRMRPLADPMRMNGCAVVLLDLPDLRDAAEAAGIWLATTLGEAGAAFRFERLAGEAT
jgi:23S rRNA (adenine2030-N6)-methyltransferase